MSYYNKRNNYYDEGYDNYSKNKSRPYQQNNNNQANYCKYGINCNNLKNFGECQYFHDKSEIPCSHGKDCVYFQKNECQFLHPQQMKQQENFRSNEYAQKEKMSEDKLQKVEQKSKYNEEQQEKYEKQEKIQNKANFYKIDDQYSGFNDFRSMNPKTNKFEDNQNDNNQKENENKTKFNDQIQEQDQNTECIYGAECIHLKLSGKCQFFHKKSDIPCIHGDKCKYFKTNQCEFKHAPQYQQRYKQNYQQNQYDQYQNYNNRRNYQNNYQKYNNYNQENEYYENQQEDDQEGEYEENEHYDDEHYNQQYDQGYSNKYYKGEYNNNNFNENFQTKVCQYGVDCVHLQTSGTCTYFHPKSEIPCVHGSNCKYFKENTCEFLHPQQRKQYQQEENESNEKRREQQENQYQEKKSKDETNVDDRKPSNVEEKKKIQKQRIDEDLLRLHEYRNKKNFYVDSKNNKADLPIYAKFFNNKQQKKH